MSETVLEVHPLSGSMAAEVRGVDLSRPLSDADFSQIEAWFHQYLVLQFPDQSLNPEQQKVFTRRFGPFGATPFVATMEEHPEIIAIVKEADEKTPLNFGGVWHSDFSFQSPPPMATLLYARDVPPFGGDTMFSNGYLAYESLSDGLKQTLDGLNAIHSARKSYGTQGAYKDDPLKTIRISNSAEGDKKQVHPLVRIHPGTGRKTLFINPVYTIGIEGWRSAEARPLLDYLYDVMVRPEFVCRLHWRKGTLTMWDNRVVMHLAVNDYDGYRREMHRTTVEGEEPIPVGQFRPHAAA